MKTDRLLGVVSILAEIDKITVQELADRFEVSKRTIFRDLDTLCCAGIPIVSYPGNGGGVAIIEGYKINRNVLSETDVQNLFTALNGLKSISRDTKVTELLAKLVPQKETAVFSKSDYVIDLSSWFSDSIIQEKLLLLHDSIQEKRCLRLEYISRSSHIIRIVEPHKLVFKQSDWYLYAYCQEKHGFRLFKISRIVSSEPLEKYFEPRFIENIEFKQHYGAELFSPGDGITLYDIVLEYDIADEFDLTSRIDASFFHRLTDSQTRYGQIRFQTSDLNWAADLIFTILDKVWIISPPALRTEINRRLEKITSRFKADI